MGSGNSSESYVHYVTGHKDINKWSGDPFASAIPYFYEDDEAAFWEHKMDDDSVWKEVDQDRTLSYYLLENPLGEDWDEDEKVEEAVCNIETHPLSAEYQLKRGGAEGCTAMHALSWTSGTVTVDHIERIAKVNPGAFRIPEPGWGFLLLHWAVLYCHLPVDVVKSIVNVYPGALKKY